MTEPGSPTDEPPTTTAAEESHETIADFVGEAADAPQDSGRAAEKESDA
jgi:hypothetical protein